MFSLPVCKFHPHSISGVETEKAWRHEGKKLLSSLPPRLVSHQHPSLLPQTLTAITTATHKLKASLGTNNIATEARKVPTPIQNALRVILSNVPLKSDQPPANSHPGSIKSVPSQKKTLGVVQKSPQKNMVIKEEVGVVTTHPSLSKAAAEQGKVYSQLESLLCEEQLMLVKGGGRRAGSGRLEISRFEGKEGGRKGERGKKDRVEKIGERKDEFSISDGGGVNNGGSSEEDMVVSEGGVSTGGSGGRDGGQPLPTRILSEIRKREPSPVLPRDLPPIKKELPLSDSSSSQDETTMSQTAPTTAEGQLIDKGLLVTTTAPAVSMMGPVVILTRDETIYPGGKSVCTVESATPTKYQATTSHVIPSTTQSQDAPAAPSEPMDTCSKTSLETPTVTNPSISSVMSTSNATCLSVEKIKLTPVSPSSLHPHSHLSTPPSPHSSFNTLPVTTKLQQQQLLPVTIPQLQQLLPGTPSQLQQLLPATQPLHAMPPEPQHLPTIPQLQQVLPGSSFQLQQLLPAIQPLYAMSPEPQNLPTTPQLQQVLPEIPSQLQQLLPSTRPLHAIPPEPQHLPTTPQLQQVLPGIPSQPLQLLPSTRPLHAIPPEPQHLPTTPQLQQVLPGILSQPHQLLPSTRPLHAKNPEPQHLPATSQLKQVLPLPQPQKTLPEQLASVEPPQPVSCVTILQPLLPSTSLFPVASSPFTPPASSFPKPAKEEVKVFHAKEAPLTEEETSPDTLIINDLIQDTSDSAVSSLASQLGLENAPLLNLDFMSFFQPNSTEGHAYTGSDSMSAFTLPPLNVDPPTVPESCCHLDVTSATAPKLPHPPFFTTQLDAADPRSCPSSIGDPSLTPSDHLSVCHPSNAESKPMFPPLDKLKPTPITDGTTLTAGETTPSASGKPADLFPPSSVEYLDLADIGSLMGNADASKLLEGIPEDMAKSIQTIVQLDEQTWN